MPVAMLPKLREDGVRVSAGTAGDNAIVNVAELVSVAVRVAVVLAVTATAVAVKGAVVLLAGTVTLAGTVSAALLEERATSWALADAALRVTVQASVAGPVRVGDAQDRLLTVGGGGGPLAGLSVIKKVAVLAPSVALRVTWTAAVTAVAFTVNDADSAPAATVMLGVVSAVDELVIVIGVAAVAISFSVTVQESVAGPVRVGDTQPSEARVGGGGGVPDGLTVILSLSWLLTVLASTVPLLFTVTLAA